MFVTLEAGVKSDHHLAVAVEEVHPYLGEAPRRHFPLVLEEMFGVGAVLHRRR